MSRITINAKINSPADLQALIDNLAAASVDDFTPGAEVKLGNARAVVAEKQVSELRAFALKFGFPVGTRGVISQAVKDAYAAYQDAPNKGAAASRARRQAREARELANA